MQILYACFSRFVCVCVRLVSCVASARKLDIDAGCFTKITFTKNHKLHNNKKTPENSRQILVRLSVSTIIQFIGAGIDNIPLSHAWDVAKPFL